LKRIAVNTALILLALHAYDFGHLGKLTDYAVKLFCTGGVDVHDEDFVTI
jgi:hypothetical protein